ncbi:hypothetical protein VHEMI09155 [[Torrubiella] hemipterigena]|uniref:chitinase n=1 Tax=[Torrubiella] hemipterigena TaxID=1531966 RepID=A0A0A1TR03_9HYPO|nr:hypothetical protein VHEMI09155 [[Torrubiella] hemipterigena]
MLYKSLVLALAASGVANAQTFSDCNPAKGDKCPPKPAVGKNAFTCDFTKGKCGQMKPLEGTSEQYTADGAKLSLKTDKEGPTLRSNDYIFFGHVDVTMRAAPGSGIVSGMVLQSDDLDEIDFEWIGRDNGHVQSNWFHFGAGPDEKYDRGQTDAVSDVTGTFHTYSFDWTPERLQWLVDGKPVRTVTVADAKGKFPTSPCYLRVGVFGAGNKNANPGVREWAGDVDMSKAPFDLYIKSVKVIDYAGGSTAAIKDVKSYSYGDSSGSAESIQFHPEGSGNTGSKGGDAPKGDSSSAVSSSVALKETASSKPSASVTLISTTMKTSTASKSSSDATQTLATDSAAASKTSGAPAATSSKASGAVANTAAASSMALVAAGVFAWLAL